MVKDRSFSPYVQVNDQASTTAIMAKTPLISCSDLDNVQYGHSLLFVKRSNLNSAYLFNIFVSVVI